MPDEAFGPHFWARSQPHPIKQPRVRPQTKMSSKIRCAKIDLEQQVRDGRPAFAPKTDWTASTVAFTRTFVILFPESGQMWDRFGRPCQTVPQPFPLTRPRSINLDMQLRCLASLNTFPVLQHTHTPHTLTPTRRVRTEMELTFSLRMLLLRVPFMPFNPHLCPLHLNALFSPH